MNERNIELLQRVKAHILAEPRRYNQFTFGRKKGTLYELIGPEPPCGTQACIAGWVYALTIGPMFDEQGDRIDASTIVDEATTQCGFTETEADRIFGDGSRWPAPFNLDLEAAVDTQERARVAARFIDYLCEGGTV